MNPVGHVHVPAAEQIPAPEHGGEQAEDWMSRSDMLLRDTPAGSCERSGAESQRMRRSADPDPDETAAHMLEDSMTEPADVDVESRELLLVGRLVNTAVPE